MITKIEAKYHKAAVLSRSCGTCEMYRPGGKCTLVQGQIRASDTCKYWEKRDDNSRKS